MAILIVEDNPVNSKILEINLRKHDYETLVVPTGRQALECLRSTPKINLVIADILMPEMNGLELLSRIKERPEWKDIPVIMCSSLTDLETVKKAVKAGCRHYLIKPINKDHLLGKVREALEHDKPVLGEKKGLISQLGLDKHSYEEIAKAFSKMVDDKIRQLEMKMEGGMEGGVFVDLSELLENAIYFGAERIKELLEKLSTREMTSDTNLEDSDCSILLRELKLLQDALLCRDSKEQAPIKAGPEMQGG